MSYQKDRYFVGFTDVEDTDSVTGDIIPLSYDPTFGELSESNESITLKGGGIYSMEATSFMLFSSDATQGKLQFYNEDTSAYIGEIGNQVPITRGTLDGGAGSLTAFSVLSVDSDTTISLRALFFVAGQEIIADPINFYTIIRKIPNPPGSEWIYCNLNGSNQGEVDIALGDDTLINFEKNQGTLDLTNHIITLKGGKTYRLSGSWGRSTRDLGDDKSGTLSFYNETTSAYIGTLGLNKGCSGSGTGTCARFDHCLSVDEDTEISARLEDGTFVTVIHYVYSWLFVRSL